MRKGFRLPTTLKEVEQRFLSKVQICENGCHEWHGAMQANGYGRFNPFGKSMYAHRFVALMKYGKLSGSKDVCHTCDNRKCVNPDHLFIGTRKENMEDCVAKNRQAKGEKLSKRFCEADILEIRRLAKNGLKIKQISEQFGASKTTIRHIVNNETWRSGNVE